MVRGKVAGLAIGGLAGYLLVNKAMNVIERTVKNICNERAWANYYKYGKGGEMVPPGYSMHKHEKDGIEHEVVKENNFEDSSQTPLNVVLSDSIKQKINDALKGSDKPTEASEEQTEAFCEDDKEEFEETKVTDENDKEKAPEETAEMADKDTVQEGHECNEDGCFFDFSDIGKNDVLTGDKVTEWNEDGKSIAGRYPFNAD